MRKQTKIRIIVRDDTALVIKPDVMRVPTKIEVLDLDPIWYRERLVGKEWVREYDPNVKAPF